MSKKQSEKLTPTTSEARYPTLVELRRDSGLLKSGLAAAVLASGLAGCGGKDEASLSGKVDASYFAQDVRSPDLGGTSTDAAPDASKPDIGPLDRAIIVDGVPFIPDHLDAGTDVAGDASEVAQDQGPDQGTGDARQDAEAVDGQASEAGAGGSTDSEIDLK